MNSNSQTERDTAATFSDKYETVYSFMCGIML